MMFLTIGLTFATKSVQTSTREQINAIPDAKKRQEARLKNWKNL